MVADFKQCKNDTQGLPTPLKDVSEWKGAHRSSRIGYNIEVKPLPSMLTSKAQHWHVMQPDVSMQSNILCIQCKFIVMLYSARSSNSWCTNAVHCRPCTCRCTPSDALVGWMFWLLMPLHDAFVSAVCSRWLEVISTAKQKFLAYWLQVHWCFHAIIVPIREGEP